MAFVSTRGPVDHSPTLADYGLVIQLEVAASQVLVPVPGLFGVNVITASVVNVIPIAAAAEPGAHALGLYAGTGWLLFSSANKKWV